MEAREALGVDESTGFYIPDGYWNDLEPQKVIDRIWEEETKDRNVEDPAEAREAVETSALRSSQLGAAAFAGASRLGLSAFASEASLLRQEIRTKEEVREFQTTVGQMVSISLQADEIRRRFGLSMKWPAEMAIICGPWTVQAPFTEKLPRSESRPILQRISQALFGFRLSPLDDPDRHQTARNLAHEIFEQASIQMKESFGGRYPRSFVKDERGRFREVDDPELALYNLFQEFLPYYAKQPLENTSTPHRVMAQRVIDARKRRKKHRRPPIRIGLGPPYDPSEENGKIPYSSLGTFEIK